jgi:hypothetical protein
MRVAYWRSIGLKWRIMETSKTSTGQTLFDQTLFVAATPVSLSAPLASEQAKQTNATCGPTSEMPLATYDPDTRSWKMYGDISLWGEQPSLENLPPSGMTQNGVLFQQPAWARITDAIESLLWPTPTVDDSKNVYPKSNRIRGLVAAVNDSCLTDPIYAPTFAAGGKLNPTWVEWLMGFPPGWTDLEG